MKTNAKALVEAESKAELLGLVRRHKVWVAAITHEYGVGVYASQTEEGLRAKVAAYCREWWEDVTLGNDEGQDEKPPENDATLIETYFHRCTGESLSVFDEIDGE